MIRIIQAEEKHIPDIFEIEKAAFSPAWMEGSLLSQLENEFAYFTVAVEDGRILGFCILHIGVDEGEIFQIAVDEQARRRGVGDLLLGDALRYAKDNGMVSIFLEVRRSNAPAIGLYKKYGFTVAGYRKKYYSYPTEDAAVMSVQLVSGLDE